MKKLLIIIAFLLATGEVLISQGIKVGAEPVTGQKSGQTRVKENKFYYGGTMGFSFGSYFSVSAEPYFAYKVTPKLHAGLKFRYQYVNDSRYNVDHTSHNYGGSAFMIYRFIPQIYFRAEYAVMNYELYDIFGNSNRTTVPFFLLGGGYFQRVSKTVTAYVEVMWDVLGDPNSPYDSGSPFVSVGASVGL